MFAIGMPTDLPLKTVIGSILEIPPGVGDLAFDRGRGGRERAGEQRAAALPLPALEVAVRGRHAVLAGLELVAVHRQAHGAAGLAPLAAGLLEDRVQPL